MPLRNWEVAVYALYLLDGATKLVHTEDIALKCHELAADSFSWVKHPEYPDKDIARVSLVDARKEKVGALVTGRSGQGKGQLHTVLQQRSLDGWQLTEKGISWARENGERLALALGQRQPKSHRQEVLQRLSRVRENVLFKNFLDCRGTFVPAIGPLAELLRCRVDAEPAVWNKRFESVRKDALVAEQRDVLDFIEACHAFITSGAWGET